MDARIASRAAMIATGFFEIDTGRDAKNWTVQLTDPSASARGAMNG